MSTYNGIQSRLVRTILYKLSTISLARSQVATFFFLFPFFLFFSWKCERFFNKTKKNALYLSVNIFSTKVLNGDTIFTSPNEDGTAILRGHPSHAKDSPLAVKRKYVHFSLILRPSVMVRPRESNPRPPALQSNALPTELILPRSKRLHKKRVKLSRDLFGTPVAAVSLHWLP